MDYKDFDISGILIEATGFDAYLGGEEVPEITELVTASASKNPQHKRYRVANMAQLKGFSRVANDTLIRKSERDLWSLEQSEDGEWVIERLFDDDGNPLKV